MNFFKYIPKFLVTVLLLLISSGSLFAQQTDVEKWIQQAREAGIEQSVLSELQDHVENKNITGAQFAAILRPAVSMTDQDLPAEIVLQKALEGFSKGVPAENIIRVVDRLGQSVTKAASIIDPWMNRPEVKEMVGRGSDAMSHQIFRKELTKSVSKSMVQDISSEALTQILDQIGEKSVLDKSGPAEVVAAVGILPDIPSSGRNPKVSGEFVVRALKSGFKANELQKLPSAIQIAQQRSELPAASVIEGVAGQMKGNVPAKQILKDLFDGKVGGGPPGDVPRGVDQNKGRGNADNGKGNSNKGRGNFNIN